MANKFIVLVVFAAAAQASLAAVDLKTAEKTSRTEWNRATDTVCKVLRNKSFSLEAAKEEYKTHRLAGDKPFAQAAHLANYPDLRALAAADANDYRKILFKILKEVRECTNYTAIKAAIKTSKKSLPYRKFLTALHAMIKDHGSADSVLDVIGKYSETLFDAIQKLAKSVCGGGNVCVANICPTKKLHDEIAEQARILYSWLQ